MAEEGIAELAKHVHSLIVVLNDGQVWRQTDSRRVRTPRNTDGLTVNIERGAMGSYFMSLGDSPVSVRASRD